MTARNDRPKVSPYLEAGSPLSCFLPACRKPFEQSCVRCEDGQFYCSHECADIGRKVDLRRVQALKMKR